MSDVHYFMRACVCTHVCAGANAHVYIYIYMSYGSQRTISGITFSKAVELPLTQGLSLRSGGLSTRLH